MNDQLAKTVIQHALDAGVREFCIAAGKRNAPLVFLLSKIRDIKIYYWPEERSAGYFALGRIRATRRPVVVITTSGTAVGNLLPAAMEAYYTQLPILLLTADRPRRQRGTGAPQCAEQVGIFSHYVDFAQDIALEEECQLADWNLQGPAHLNVCFEEPEEDKLSQDFSFSMDQPAFIKTKTTSKNRSELENFIHNVKNPVVVVGALNIEDRENVARFLSLLKAPIYAEAISGIREDPRLTDLRICSDQLFKNAAQANYPIDGVLRIGSIPTCRIWRDLEELAGKIRVCSISHLPFSGLSWNGGIYDSLKDFFSDISYLPIEKKYACEKWLTHEKKLIANLKEIYQEEPQAEISLIHYLSKLIPETSLVYLGNSLPIREWDQAATWQQKNLKVEASRGLCGIDGQIATFLGLCTPEQQNWAIIGDLTALYDLVAPWIYPQLAPMDINLVIINNGGGQIFSRMFSNPAFLNLHDVTFQPLAELWKWHYEKWETIPTQLQSRKGARLIEIQPNDEATKRALQKIRKL